MWNANFEVPHTGRGPSRTAPIWKSGCRELQISRCVIQAWAQVAQLNTECMAHANCELRGASNGAGPKPHNSYSNTWLTRHANMEVCHTGGSQPRYRRTSLPRQSRYSIISLPTISLLTISLPCNLVTRQSRYKSRYESRYKFRRWLGGGGQNLNLKGQKW